MMTPDASIVETFPWRLRNRHSRARFGPADRASRVRVLHARRGSLPEDMPLAEFMAGCRAYFEADGLIVEAVADDGTIEAVRVKDAPAFALGIQWHPEARLADDTWSQALFTAFGDACRAYAARKRASAATRAA